MLQTLLYQGYIMGSLQLLYSFIHL